MVGRVVRCLAMESLLHHNKKARNFLNNDGHNVQSTNTHSLTTMTDIVEKPYILLWFYLFLDF